MSEFALAINFYEFVKTSINEIVFAIKKLLQEEGSVVKIYFEATFFTVF